MVIFVSILAALAIAGGLLLFHNFRTKGLKVRISKADLQRHVDRALPVQGEVTGIGYSVDRVLLDPRPDGRIGFKADMAGRAVGVGFGLTMSGSGALRYKGGSFYLADFRIEGVGNTAPTAPAPAANTKPPEEPGFWSGVASLATKAWDAAAPTVAATRERGEAILAQAVEHIPLYTLDADDFRQSLARLVLRDVKVVDGAIVAELGRPDAPRRTA